MIRLLSRTKYLLNGARARASTTALPTTSSGGIKKRDEDDMLEKIDIEDLPRAQKRFAKQFEKVNEQRVKEIFAKNYKNHISLGVLVCLVVGIYYYTMYAVKQETFLEEIDQEMAQEDELKKAAQATK